MDAVVDLLQWRRSRDLKPAGDCMDRLDRAIRRLDEAASASLDDSGPLAPWVETEMLAIVGALSMDLCDEGAARAERLAERILRPRKAARRR